MLIVFTNLDGTRYLENYAGPDQYDGTCHTGQAVTFDGTTQYVEISIPASGTNLVYFDYTTNTHIQIAVTGNSVETLYPPGTASNITVWNVELTTEELQYMDRTHEWIAATPIGITLVQAPNSTLEPSNCLIWYPMCETISVGNQLYDHVDLTFSTIITLNNYSESRRLNATNLDTGMQVHAYTQDIYGRIVDDVPTFTFEIPDIDPVVNTHWQIVDTYSWLLEEGLDYTHYVYYYNSNIGTITRYVDGIWDVEFDWSAEGDATALTDDRAIPNDLYEDNLIYQIMLNISCTLANVLVDDFSQDNELYDDGFNNVIVFNMLGCEDTYKLTEHNFDYSKNGARNRQYFRLWKSPPVDIQYAVQDMYELFVSLYSVGIISVESGEVIGASDDIPLVVEAPIELILEFEGGAYA